MPRHYSDFLSAYIDYTRVSEAPEIAHRFTGVWTIAGALRRSVWYNAGGFDWTPNFYIVLTGPPGVIQKSTTASNGSRLLEHLPSVRFGPDSATWHGLIPKFNSAEALTDTSKGPLKVSPLTMAVSELGSFLKLSQEGLDAVLIDMWDGAARARPWEHTTQTHGDKIIWNGLLNMLGCTTLGWLRENMPASALETGLVSRMLFVYADKKRERIAIPKLDPRWNPAAQREREQRLIEDLQDIASLRGPFELSPEAAVWQKSWYESLEKRSEHMMSERFVVYDSRKQTHVMKLAMAIAAGRNQHPVLQLDALKDALQMLEVVERGIVRIFDTIGGPKESAHVRELIATVGGALGHPMSFPALLRALGGSMTHDELGLAIRHAVSAGHLKSIPGADNGARPGVVLSGEETPHAELGADHGDQSEE